LNQHLKGFNREKQIFLFLSIYYWLQENQWTSTLDIYRSGFRFDNHQ
jgi:hypothetical protein